MWRYFKSESFAFWMICLYLFLEYVRPQSIIPELDFLPWTQLAVLGSLAGCFIDKTVKWTSTRLNLLLFLFFILILISSAFAFDSSISYRYLENFYTWLIIYLLVINIVNSKNRFFIFICIFLLASFKLSLSLSITWAMRGFAFTGWGLSGPPGFFQNSGELAIQMLVYWPVAFAIAIALKSYVTRIKYYILLLMPITGIMVILGASSRGAQLALFVQLILLNFRSIFKVKVLVAFSIILFSLWNILPQEQKERFQVAGDDRTSIQRLFYWENGYEMMKSHPVTGVGYFNFVKYYESFFREDLLYERAELPHNIFIQVGSELGIFALVVYILSIVYVYLKTAQLRTRMISSDDDYFYIPFLKYLNISLVGFVVAGQFVSVVYYPFLWIHFSVFVCLINIVGATNISKFRQGRRNG
ncbi:O-antigen ligase family protein [Marinobacter algicola]|uniref:O-antigen ligase family protein n=1 Tax=Marinobacter algicola TaxID=236100 RepID=UPI003BAAF79B